MSLQPEFWKNKKLEEFTKEEWEALCDRCGWCCLHKFEDEGEVHYTNVVCKFYDLEKCVCTDYENRSSIVPDCVPLTPDRTYEFNWLPPTCAYRLIAENKPLPEWHHLIHGDTSLMHELQMSIKHFAEPEDDIDFDEIEDYFLDEDF